VKRKRQRLRAKGNALAVENKIESSTSSSSSSTTTSSSNTA